MMFLIGLQIESVQKANRILREADEVVEYKMPQKSKRLVKKKKKTVLSKKTGHNHKPDASKHYRLNLADIPFVAGKVATTTTVLCFILFHVVKTLSILIVIVVSVIGVMY